MRLNRNSPQAVVSDGYLSVREAAVRLRICEEQVRRLLRNGLLPGVKMPGPARNTGWRIPVDALKQLFAVKRNATFADALLARVSPEMSESAQEQELQRRACEIADALGSPRPVIALLIAFKVSRIGDLHPRDYKAFRRELLALAPDVRS